MNRFVQLFFAGLLMYCSCFDACELQGAGVPGIRYQLWTNTSGFSCDELLAAKKQRFRRTADTHSACFDYMMFSSGNHYRMIEESVRLNYFIAGSDLNLYLEGLLQRILDSNIPGRRKGGAYRVFVLRTAEANAYAFGDRLFGVSLGLMARLETEDELISVLCHELAHELLGHNDELLMRHALMNTSGVIGDSISYLLDESRYSKAGMEAYLSRVYSASMKKNRLHELEADSLGLLLLQGAGYAGGASARALMHIQGPLLQAEKINLPSYLRSQGAEIRPHWVYKGYSSRLNDLVETEFYFMDTLHSHPAFSEREARLLALGAGQSDSGAFSERFLFHRYSSLVQLALSSYRSGDPSMSLYCALALKYAEPGDEFADQLIQISLCKSVFLKRELRLSASIGINDTALGLVHNQIIHLMYKLRENECADLLCLLAQKSQSSNTASVFAYTSALFSAYYCMPPDKYNFLLNHYKTLHGKGYFENDLIYLPKRRKQR